MSHLRIGISAGILALLLGDVVSAQAIPATASADPTPSVKSQLRQLVVAQEKYFVDHGTYTTDVSALGMYKGRASASDSIWVQVVQAGGRSWWGQATHRAHRGKTCIIYVGYLSDFTGHPMTQDATLPVQKEGEPLCDPI